MANKTSVKITGTKEIRDNVLKFLNKEIKESSTLQIIGKEASDQIRNRTRGRLEEYKQEPLTDGTVKRRKALLDAGNMFDDRLSRPKQSNLTLSGQLLGAISFRINQALGTVSIILLEGRVAYTGKRGKVLENTTNKEIKKDLESRGRKFLFISSKLAIQLEKRITQILRTKLSIYNRLKRK